MDALSLRVAPALAASLLLTVGTPAHAGDAGRHSVLVGAGLGGGSQWLAIDGRPVARVRDAGTFVADVEVGYRHAVTRRLALALLARFGSFRDGWADTVGERRTRLDLRLATELTIPLDEARDERPAVTVGLAFGPTLAWLRPPRRSAVIERYDTGVGMHGALRLGLQVRTSAGTAACFGLEGAAHRVSADRTAFLRGGAPAVWERYRFDDASLGLVVGYALSL
jgi:hypothetical protein